MLITVAYLDIWLGIGKCNNNHGIEPTDGLHTSYVTVRYINISLKIETNYNNQKFKYQRHR